MDSKEVAKEPWKLQGPSTTPTPSQRYSVVASISPIAAYMRHNVACIHVVGYIRTVLANTGPLVAHICCVGAHICYTVAYVCPIVVALC